MNCVDSGFAFVATSSTVGGDDGDFYFPYILDPQSSAALLVGTCRVWRGSRTGGAYTVLSPNFDTLGSGICSGNEVNLVRALAAGGPTDANGSQVIYATTSGNGPLNLSTPTGGHVWVTTNATNGTPSFADVTNNGPQGSINPNQFPISSVAIDPSDPTGTIAYVTVMGFTGGAGHVWKTTNAGATWTDFTANLPDAPVNAVAVDPAQPQVYVGTDVGVFASSTATANWTELGPVAAPGQTGFLPNVAVTALGIFNSGGTELLRASTYGRGMWQFGLTVTQDFQLSISNSPLTIFSGHQGAFAGSITGVNGYANSIALSCVAGTTKPPGTCSVLQSPVTYPYPLFAVTVGGPTGDYNFNVQAVGSDSKQITHIAPVTLHVVSFALTTPSPANVTVPRGTTSSPSTFQVTAAGSFDQSVILSCSVGIAKAACALTPGTTVMPTAANPVLVTASIAVPAGTAPGIYPVAIQATTAGAPATITAAFELTVTFNPDFVISEGLAFPEVNAGSADTSGPISIAAQDGFNGTVSLSCPTTFGANSCSITPTSVNSYPATATLTINGASFAAGSYSLSIAGTSAGTSGTVTHSVAVPFNVGDYSISGTQALTVGPGGQGSASFTLTSSHFYSGNVDVTCDATALSGATCTLTPANPIAVASNGTANFSALINVPTNAADGVYNIDLTTHDSNGAPSHSVVVALTVAQDFQVISTTLSQTVNAGQTTGPYNLTIQPVGSSFNAAVTFTCSNLPILAQCIFAPSTPVTPGNSAASMIMTISTTATTTALRESSDRISVYGVWLLLPGIVGMFIYYPRKRKIPAMLLLLIMLVLPSCGGVSTGGNHGHPGTPPGQYKVTVTGTSPGASADAGQSTQVTLIVN